MKRIISYLALMIVSIIFATIVSILLFHTIIFANVHVLMYRGILIILFTGILLGLFLFFEYKFLKSSRIKKGLEQNPFFDIKDIISIVIVFICINVTFFTLVPVTVERSVSVFTLSQMEQSPNYTMTKDEAEKVFNDVYVKMNDAFGKRFDEQIVTGSIKENADGSYTLTDRGHFLVNMFRAIGKIYNADCKNLY